MLVRYCLVKKKLKPITTDGTGDVKWQCSANCHLL